MDYVPIFIANGFYKNRSEFKTRHVVYAAYVKFPKIDRYLDVGRLAKLRGQLLVEMPFVRHTRRRSVEVLLPYDKDALDLVLKKRWHVFEERPIDDIAEMFSVARRVVNSHPSRLEMVCNLWETHPRLIVFYNFNYELESLRSLREYYEVDQTPSTNSSEKWKNAGSSLLVPSGISTDLDTTRSGSRKKASNGLLLPGSSTSLTSSSQGKSPVSSSTTSTVAIAEWNGHKHQPVPTTDRWLYLVQYTAGAEGWNCITTDAMVMYSQNYSWKIDHQARGRIDRLNTPFEDLWYYNFTSDSWLDRAISKSLKAKQNFNEAKYKSLIPPPHRRGSVEIVG